MKKLAVCEYCGNIFMMGDRVWTYRGDKFCSEDCASKAEYLGKQGKWKNDMDKKEKENKEMKEIKLTIDGKEIQLTDEQLKMLGIEPEKKRKNPFDRVGNSDRFFAIDNMNGIQTCTEMSYARDEAYYNGINYFNDKKFAKQVALHQLLYRKLLKFAYDNECEDTAEWDGTNLHWAIRYDYACGTFTTDYQNTYGAQEVYFYSEKDAERAIEEVVEPFMKEHPEFVW